MTDAYRFGGERICSTTQNPRDRWRPMTKARVALASVPLLTARGLLSLVLGVCAFAQNTRPPDTPNPSLFQLQHTSWTERDGAPPTINDISQAPDGSLWLGSSEGLYRFDGFTFRAGTCD